MTLAQLSPGEHFRVSLAHPSSLTARLFEHEYVRGQMTTVDRNPRRTLAIACYRKNDGGKETMAGDLTVVRT